MAVTEQTPINSYVANGVTTVFAFEFLLLQSADLTVRVTDTNGVTSTKVLDVDYTVAGLNITAGGTVTLLVAPASGSTVVVLRESQLVRATQYQDNGDLLAETVNLDFDRLWLAIQEGYSVMGQRSVRGPVGETLTELPTAAMRANYLLGFDSFGNPAAVAPAGGSAAELATDLTNSVTATKGAGQVGFSYALGYAAGTIGKWLKDLASSTGASFIGFIQSATGAIATTVQAALGQTYNAVTDFGADNTGAANCTAALLAFYNACILAKRRGHIPAGTYKITTGVLVFNTAQTDKAWPDITTDGYNATIFSVDAAAATNAPILTWTNGWSIGTAWHGWLGGSHGGVTFTDATGGVASLRSAISVQGVNGLRLGRMVGTSLRGDLVTIPQALSGGNNPDPNACSNVTFDILEANSCAGWAIQNLNFVGMDSWIGNQVRIVGGGLGGVFGMGSGCKMGELVVANSTGWAFDDGTQAGAVGGSPQRFYFSVAELDNVQNGLRLNKSSLANFGGIRFINRFQTAPNASANYYPRTAVSLGGGASANVNNIDLQMFHRVEAGGTLANLGVWIDGHSDGNISSLSIDIDYADNGALGITDAYLIATLLSGLATSSVYQITKRTKTLFNTADKTIGIALGSTAVSIVPNTGYTGAAGKLGFASQPMSTYSNPLALNNAAFTGSTATNVLTLTSLATGSFTLGAILYGAGIPVGTVITGLLTGTLGASGSTYSLSTSPGTLGSAALTCVNTVFTAPRAGLYEFMVKFGLTVAIGTRVRCGFYDGTNTHGTNYGYQVNAGYQSYSATAQIYLTAGQQIWPTADQNTAGAVAVSINHYADECEFTAKDL